MCSTKDTGSANDAMTQNSSLSAINASHLTYINDFRVEQCQLFLQHKCTQHRPYACFYWHFMNQKRRHPQIFPDGTYNYNCDVYCDLYDEQTGICSSGDDCPFVHRNAGDTERRYHPRYYKTAWCTFETDMRGNCIKNGTHCALAHSPVDVRMSALRIIGKNESTQRAQYIVSMLEKDRQVNDDPKWNETIFVLEWYKTEPCKRPARVCRQGYACPQYHNPRDRRRNPFVFTYRSIPCPNVKQVDEWNEPSLCENGDHCSYCHTRTEQQFHPEIYKTTRCNDIVQNRYCPRGTFCAFAHSEGDQTDIRDIRPGSSQTHLCVLSEHASMTNSDSYLSDPRLFGKSIKASDQLSQKLSPGSPQNFIESSKQQGVGYNQAASNTKSRPHQCHEPSDMSSLISFNSQTPSSHYQQNKGSTNKNMLTPQQTLYSKHNLSSSERSAFRRISGTSPLHQESFLLQAPLKSNQMSNRNTNRTLAPPPGLCLNAANPESNYTSYRRLSPASIIMSKMKPKHNAQLSSSFACLTESTSDTRATFQHQTSLELMISRSLENIGIKTSSPINFDDNNNGYSPPSERSARVGISPNYQQSEHDYDSLSSNLIKKQIGTIEGTTQVPFNSDSSLSGYGYIGEKRVSSPIPSPHTSEESKDGLPSQASPYLLSVPNLQDSIYNRSCASSPTSLYPHKEDQTRGSLSPNYIQDFQTFSKSSSKILAFAENVRLEKEVNWLRGKVYSLEQCINQQKQALELMQEHVEQCSQQTKLMESERNNAIRNHNDVMNELIELKKTHNQEAARIWSEHTSELNSNLQCSQFPTRFDNNCHDDIEWAFDRYKSPNANTESQNISKISTNQSCVNDEYITGTHRIMSGDIPTELETQANVKADRFESDRKSYRSTSR